MKTKTRAGDWTYDDFCFRVREDEKGDLIDGVIYMASPENTDANELFVWLLTLLNLYARKQELGKVYGSRVALRLDDRNGPEPDILFVKKERLHLVKRGHIDGPADLAVEIVSPESVERDYGDKMEQYRRFGVPEYWIVDELEERVTLHRLNTRAEYREVRPRKGELHSQALQGFWLRSDWLWRDPRPDETETLATILSRQA
jgi:Uma2 family endonuclease